MSTDLYLQSLSVSEHPQRSVHVNPVFLHLQRLLAHLSFVHLHFTRWMIASGAGGSVGITGIHAFLSSSHFQPKHSGDGKTGLGTMSLFHAVADSGHEEPLDATQPVWGGVVVI